MATYKRKCVLSPCGNVTARLQYVAPYVAVSNGNCDGGSGAGPARTQIVSALRAQWTPGSPTVTKARRNPAATESERSVERITVHQQCSQATGIGTGAVSSTTVSGMTCPSSEG